MLDPSDLEAGDVVIINGRGRRVRDNADGMVYFYGGHAYTHSCLTGIWLHASLEDLYSEERKTHTPDAAVNDLPRHPPGV